MKVETDCYVCHHKRKIPASRHIACTNMTAHVVGSEHGKKMGWFNWPISFDPIWLVSCDGFKQIARKV